MELNKAQSTFDKWIAFMPRFPKCDHQILTGIVERYGSLSFGMKMVFLKKFHY